MEEFLHSLGLEKTRGLIMGIVSDLSLKTCS